MSCRRLLKVLLIAVAFVAISECFSALLLYQYYSAAHRAFLPHGSSTIWLLRRVSAHLYHQRLLITADHFPVFVADPTLGYAMNTGAFQITERADGQVHTFHLTINEKHERVTSYERRPSKRKLYLTGDSQMHGWGLDDEQTLGWLLQERLSDFEVVDLSANSYSTIQTLLQVQQIANEAGAGDVLILEYHPDANNMNVMDAKVLSNLRSGFEQQLARAGELSNIELPFGVVTVRNNLLVQRIKLSCVPNSAKAVCIHPPSNQGQKESVTEHAFDAIARIWPGRILVVVTGAPAGDTVVAHLKAGKFTCVDFPDDPADADLYDLIATDLHAGAFLTYNRFDRIYEELHDMLVASQLH